MKWIVIAALAVTLTGCATTKQCLTRHGYTYCHTWVGHFPMGFN